MRPRVLYIAGTGRSGSTVLARCLEAELEAVHVGEARYVWSRGVDEAQLCECGRLFGLCDYWSQVLNQAYPDGVAGARRCVAALAPRIDRMRHIPVNAARMAGVRSSKHLQAYADNIEPLYKAMHHVAGVPLIIDSSKDPSYLFALSATQRVDLQILHLVRDSRAVAYSWTRKRLRPEIHWEEQFMNILPPVKSARIWMQYNAAIDLAGLLGAHSTRVRYEDFVTDPGQCITNLVAGTGFQRRSSPLERIGRHSFSGNPMRFEAKPTQVIADNAWQTELRSGDRRKVSLLTAPLLLKYGYPLW